MKKILLICLLFCTKNSFANKNYSYKPKCSIISDTTVIPQILALPLQSYIGKPLDSLLSVLPVIYDDQGFKPAKLGYVRGIYRLYGTEEFNHCSVQIFFDTIQFLPVPNYNQTNTWDMNLAKKEIVSHIRVVKNNTICLFGCDNPKYY